MAISTIATSSKRVGGEQRGRSILAHYGPWALQAGLAALFLFAGSGKLFASSHTLSSQFGLNPAFLRFIGACEVLGGIGLIGPGVLRAWRALTPIAAAGLVAIMIGATVVTVVQDGVLLALGPVLVGVSAATLVRSRWSWIASTRAR